MFARASTFLAVAFTLSSASFRAANAEELYVRPDGGPYGAENGADWDNAFNGLADVVWGSGSGQVGPGDVLYIAGGRYTSNLVVGTDGVDGNWITVRRATADTHGTDSGWQSGWDSLVHLDGAYINLQDRSFVEVDGVTEWGIRLSGLNESMGAVANVFIGADEPQAYSEYISLRNLELIGPGRLTCDGTRGIGVYGNYTRVDRLLISHIKAHEYSGACIRLGNHDEVLIENSMIYNVENASAEACGGENPHNTHIAMYGTDQNDHIVIRNNLLYQEYDDNQVNGGYALGFGYVSGDVDVYNNVFFNVNNPSLTAQNPVPTVAGTKIRFYNNTFVGYRTMVWGDSSRFDMVNNIFCNKGFDPAYTRWPYTQTLAETESHNLFCLDEYTGSFATGTNLVLPDGVDPFEDYQAPDIALRFHLRQDSPARNVGDDLSSVFTDDIEGHTRPSGSWDIGAYEYVEGGDTLGAGNRVSSGCGFGGSGGSAIGSLLLVLGLLLSHQRRHE